jgi:hypothetical protein
VIKVYRRPASKYKRPTFNPQKEVADSQPLQMQTEEIPLPNEADIPSLSEGENRIGLTPFRFWGKDFYLDDLILLGLLI